MWRSPMVVKMRLRLALGVLELGDGEVEALVQTVEDRLEVGDGVVEVDDLDVVQERQQLPVVGDVLPQHPLRAGRGAPQ